MLDSHKFCVAAFMGSSFFKVEYCKSYFFVACFSSEFFYICKPIRAHLAQVYATGKCDPAPPSSSCCHLGLFLVVPELPISIVEVLHSTIGDCATCMLFGSVVYIYLVLICSHMRVCVWVC